MSLSIFCREPSPPRRWLPWRSPAAMAVWVVVALVCTLASRSVAHAGGGPENAVVVVNADSPSSKLIANHYVAMRKIPDRNVIVLSGIPYQETIELNPFRELILKPVLSQIEQRGLVGSVDYILYSADFPTTVRVTRHLDVLKKLTEQQGRGFQAKLFNGSASLTSATWFASQVLRDDPSYLSLQSNRYYRLPARELLSAPFVGDMQADYRQAVAAFSAPVSSERFLNGVSILKSLAKQNPGQTAVLYQLARFTARQGLADQASKWLSNAIRVGWRDDETTLSESAFAEVRSDALFRRVEAQIGNDGNDFLPSQGFRQLYPWGNNGMLNHSPGQAQRYFMSMVLAITRNDGNTEAEALAQLSTSITADFTKPEGTVYYCKTNDVRTKTRLPNFAVAIRNLEEMGRRGIIVGAMLPENRKDVVGAMIGASKFDWGTSQSRILPGALCDNLTSYGGRVGQGGGGQTRLNEFLRFGAAGATGTVTEPYALQQKFPHPMVHVHYARGCSLAESFYQSLQGPFQILIVGDALCQPFAVPPAVAVAGLGAGETVSGLKVVTFDDSMSEVPVAGIEIFVDGRLVKRDNELEPWELDTESMSDGFHEVRIVPVANTLVETRGQSVIPFTVNNHDHSVTLAASKNDFDINEIIELTASKNIDGRLAVFHHYREVGVADGEPGNFLVPAVGVGRGPVSLRAVVIDESGKEVSSEPLHLKINGPILTKRPKTEKKKARSESAIDRAKAAAEERKRANELRARQP